MLTHTSFHLDRQKLSHTHTHMHTHTLGNLLTRHACMHACIYTHTQGYLTLFFNLPSIKASVEQFSPFSFWHAPPEKNSPTILAPCSVQMETQDIMHLSNFYLQFVQNAFYWGYPLYAQIAGDAINKVSIVIKGNACTSIWTQTLCIP